MSGAWMKANGGTRRVVVAIVALVVLSACGGRVVEQPAPLAETANDGVDGSTEEVAKLVEPPECEDNGSCAAGFVVADTFYALSCGAVRPDAVTEETLARGELYGEDVEVRRVKGVRADVLVAVSREGGRCAEGDVPLSPWSLAFPPGASQTELDAAICVAVVDEHRARNNC